MGSARKRILGRKGQFSSPLSGILGQGLDSRCLEELARRALVTARRLCAGGIEGGEAKSAF